MSRERITSVDGSAALLLPEEILNSLGLNIGDEVNINVVDNKLILRALDDLEREQKLQTITDDLFERRQSAYQQLAKGAE